MAHRFIAFNRLRALQQCAHGRGRVIDQGLLIPIEHLVAHRGYERVRLALTTRAKSPQPLHDMLCCGAGLGRGHDNRGRQLAELCMREFRIDKPFELGLEPLAGGVDLITSSTRASSIGQTSIGDRFA